MKNLEIFFFRRTTPLRKKIYANRTLRSPSKQDFSKCSDRKKK